YYLSAQSANDKLLKKLNETIANTNRYDADKYGRIGLIKDEFAKSGNKSLSAKYEFYKALFEEYKEFKFDTAFIYVKQLEEIASGLDEPFKIAESKIKLSFVLLSAGMYGEADDIMKQINIKDQPDSLKAEFYLARGRYYYDVAD